MIELEPLIRVVNRALIPMENSVVVARFSGYADVLLLAEQSVSIVLSSSSTEPSQPGIFLGRPE